MASVPWRKAWINCASSVGSVQDWATATQALMRSVCGQSLALASRASPDVSMALMATPRAGSTPHSSPNLIMRMAARSAVLASGCAGSWRAQLSSNQPHSN